MRRDPKGMEFSNLIAPKDINDPPRDAYKKVLKIARHIVYRNYNYQWLADNL